MTESKSAARRLAAKKAARTRAANRAQMQYYQEVTLPGMERLQMILSYLLTDYPGVVQLRWNPSRDTGRKLKHGVRYGKLVGFESGRLLRVLPEGYKRPITFHPAFWEICPSRYP